jgi:hypothetical protein
LSHNSLLFGRRKADSVSLRELSPEEIAITLARRSFQVNAPDSRDGALAEALKSDNNEIIRMLLEAEIVDAPSHCIPLLVGLEQPRIEPTLIDR